MDYTTRKYIPKYLAIYVKVYECIRLLANISFRRGVYFRDAKHPKRLTVVTTRERVGQIFKVTGIDFSVHNRAEFRGRLSTRDCDFRN